MVSWQIAGRELRSASRYAASLLGDSSRLVSVEALPEVTGPACEWEPAAASETLASAVQAAAPATAKVRKTLDLSQRKPIRTIRDP